MKDAPIFNAKRHCQKPLFVKSQDDGNLAAYRRYYSQFYSENSPRLNSQKNSLDWWLLNWMLAFTWMMTFLFIFWLLFTTNMYAVCCVLFLLNASITNSEDPDQISLISVHAVCLYGEIYDVYQLHVDAADDIVRRHYYMHCFVAAKGLLTRERPEMS